MSFLERLLRRIKCEEGRQRTGYHKYTLFNRLGYDCYLVYYPQGSYISAHYDKVEDRRHYRMNIILKKSNIGGQFRCLDPIFSKYRVNVFRPDISEHSVTEIEDGYRLVFSFGWLRTI